MPKISLEAARVNACQRLPTSMQRSVSDRYIELYEHITGEKFDKAAEGRRHRCSHREERKRVACCTQVVFS